MTAKPVAIEGDKDCCTIPTCGACFNIEPVILQDFVYINGTLVIVHDTEFDAPCISSETANTRASQDHVKIDGISVNRDEDVSSGCHSFEGITVSGQGGVYIS